MLDRRNLHGLNISLVQFFLKLGTNKYKVFLIWFCTNGFLKASKTKPEMGDAMKSPF